MIKYSKIQFALALLLVSSHLVAGSVDLSLSITPMSISNLSDGDVGEFSITISNDGPAGAGLSSPHSFPISIDTERMYLDNNSYLVSFSINPNVVQDCVLYSFIIDPRPGDPVSIIYSFYTPSIPAGESITCHGLYAIHNDNGFRAVEWSPLSILDNDTDATNDFSVMKFQGQVKQIPSLSIYSLILLALVMMAFAYRFRIKT